MKLRELLDIVDYDDMVEVYADDGITRPCQMKLVNAFQMSDWGFGEPSDIRGKLEYYLNREVTGIATVKLYGCVDDMVVAMRVYIEQKEGDKDVLEQGVRDSGGCAVKPGDGNQHDGHGHGQVKKVVGVLVHDHSVPELVIREIPEGHGIPNNLVVLPGIDAPDTDGFGDDTIGLALAGRLVSACDAAKALKSFNRSAMCEHLGFTHAILCDLVKLVGASATDTVSEESVEALIRTAIDRVQRAGKAMGFKIEEME